MRRRDFVMGAGLVVMPHGSRRAMAVGQGPDAPEVKARLEVDEKADCFTVRLFIKNEGEAELELTYGHGGGGKTVVPGFTTGEISITPPIYQGMLRRAFSADKMRIPPRQEVLYDTYTMGYPRKPHEGETRTIQAFIEFTDWGPRPQKSTRPLRMRTEPIPFRRARPAKQ